MTTLKWVQEKVLVIGDLKYDLKELYALKKLYEDWNTLIEQLVAAYYIVR